jgi:N-acetylglucosamine-6-phosphate deacetylase
MIEQHIHGAFGVDFNTASVDDVLDLSHRILKEGVGYIFPTLRQHGVLPQGKKITFFSFRIEGL